MQNKLFKIYRKFKRNFNKYKSFFFPEMTSKKFYISVKIVKFLIFDKKSIKIENMQYKLNKFYRNILQNMFFFKGIRNIQ